MTTRIRTGLTIPEVTDVDEDGFGVAEFPDGEAEVLVKAGYATYVDDSEPELPPNATNEPPPSTRTRQPTTPKAST